VKKLFAVLAVLLLAGACGIKPTGAIPAGPAPTLQNTGADGRGTELTLYFVRDGRVAPVTRETEFSTSVGTALSTLLNGPSDAEAADGYTTMLPLESGQIALAPDPPARITFAFPLKRLNTMAINQLVCTAFAALATQSRYVIDGIITLVGTDVELPSQTCQAF
jgi:hypothetical protein